MMRYCRRLIDDPGVGPVVALTYRATVDVPSLPKIKAVRTVLGLTVRRNINRAAVDRNGRISALRR